MKARNVRDERVRARDEAAQVFCWCIVIALNQDEGIGAKRLEKACKEMKMLEDSYQKRIQLTGRRKATEAMGQILDGVCNLEISLPMKKYPKNRREEQIRMAENEGAQIAWLVMASSSRSTFGFGKERLERLKNESLSNYRQYLDWKYDAGRDYALEQIRKCASYAIGEELFVNDCVEDPARVIPTKRGPDPSAAIKISSTLSARIAKRDGVKNVPLLVMSDAAALQEMQRVSAMSWKDIK